MSTVARPPGIDSPRSSESSRSNGLDGGINIGQNSKQSGGTKAKKYARDRSSNAVPSSSTSRGLKFQSRWLLADEKRERRIEALRYKLRLRVEDVGIELPADGDLADDELASDFISKAREALGATPAGLAVLAAIAALDSGVSPRSRDVVMKSAAVADDPRSHDDEGANFEP